MVTSTFRRSFARQASVALFGLTACVSVFAVSTWNNFNLSSGCTPGTGSGTTIANPVATCTTPTGAEGTLALTGVSTGTVNSSGSSTTTPNFNSALIYDWGTSNGLGVVAKNENSSATGPHAIDNKSGTDAMLLNFSVATNLTSVKLGWNATDSPTGTTSSSYKDSDLSVFAWVGGGTGPTMANFGPGNLLAVNSGWELVGNFFNVGATSNNDINTGSSRYSSHWLVSAYNSAYGGTAVDTYKDAFKVLAISACGGSTCQPTPGVPEPGSLALISAAFMGFVVSRRRLGKASS